MIKAVLFDYFGVIKNDSYMSIDCVEIYNMPTEEIKKFREKTHPIMSELDKGLISEKEFWKAYSEALGKPEPKNCADKYREIFKRDIRFYTEIFDLAKELKNMGIKTAILSNVFKFRADIIKENGGYDGFDPVILSYEVGASKPDLEIYKIALEKVGVKPEECIFIDDKEENLVPARQLGIATVLAKEPNQIVRDVMAIINKN